MSEPAALDRQELASRVLRAAGLWVAVEKLVASREVVQPSAVVWLESEPGVELEWPAARTPISVGSAAAAGRLVPAVGSAPDNSARQNSALLRVEVPQAVSRPGWEVAHRHRPLANRASRLHWAAVGTDPAQVGHDWT